jgi:hypothetical protein
MSPLSPSRLEYNRRYYWSHHDQVLEGARRYYQRHREKILAENKLPEKRKRLTAAALARRIANPAHYREICRQFRKRRKAETLKHYSPSLTCQRCGFADIRALSIDHVKGGGHRHVTSIGGTEAFYLWLKKNKYPPGFQVLCMNCQFIKREEQNELGKDNHFDSKPR